MQLSFIIVFTTKQRSLDKRLIIKRSDSLSTLMTSVVRSVRWPSEASMKRTWISLNGSGSAMLTSPVSDSTAKYLVGVPEKTRSN